MAIVPRVIQPDTRLTYANYARDVSDSARPELRADYAFLPNLGPASELIDLGGMGSNGTLEGNSTFDLKETGFALDFAGGTTDRVDLSAVNLDVGSKPYSIVIRARLNETPALLALFSLTNGSNVGPTIFWWDSGNGLIADRNPQGALGYATQLSSDPDITEWHTYTYTWDGASDRGTLYVDGVDLSVNSSSQLNNDADTKYLAGWRTTAYQADMDCDLLLMYQRELTPAEIWELYKDPLAGYRPKPLVISSTTTETPASDDPLIGQGIHPIPTGLFNQGLHRIETGIIA